MSRSHNSILYSTPLHSIPSVRCPRGRKLHIRTNEHVAVIKDIGVKSYTKISNKPSNLCENLQSCEQELVTLTIRVTDPTNNHQYVHLTADVPRMHGLMGM